MLVAVMISIYIAMWLITVHIQFLMRNEKKQDKMWIRPVFGMIGISMAALIVFLLH